MNNVRKIPSNITKITAIVETIEAPIPCIVPLINIVATVIRNGNLPITRNKIICKYCNKSFSRRINNSTTNTTSSIATKPHTHGSDKMVTLNLLDKQEKIKFDRIYYDVYFRL